MIGAKDREGKQIKAKVIQNTDKPTLQGFIAETVSDDATAYTDEHHGYKDLPYNHETVCHSISEHVRDQAHTNGIESFWTLLKRGYHGIYHHMSEKHLDRYINEFAGRFNARDIDTIDQMGKIARGLQHK